MLSVPKTTSPPMVDHKKYNSMSSASSVKKGGALDFWSENIHFAHFHEEPDTAPPMAVAPPLEFSELGAPIIPPLTRTPLWFS